MRGPIAGAAAVPGSASPRPAAEPPAMGAHDLANTVVPPWIDGTPRLLLAPAGRLCGGGRPLRLVGSDRWVEANLKETDLT